MTSPKFSARALAIAVTLAASTVASAETARYGDVPRGFYQIVAHGDEVFAALAGTIEDSMADPVTYPPGTRPGAVLVFDAATLQLKQEIPLQADAGALALNLAKNQLVVGHTHHHAVSTIDLDTRQTRYHELDTRHGDAFYRVRYVTADAQGDLYVSAYDWRSPFQSAVFKFGPSGQKAPGFAVQPFDGFSLPVFITSRFSTDGQPQLLHGSAQVRAADLQTGAVEYQSASPIRSTGQEAVSFYNYIEGPGNTIIATNNFSWFDGSQGDPNLYLFERGKENQPQSLFTANTALEAIYHPQASQLYATSFGSYFNGKGAQVLSIIGIDGSQPFGQSRFENIPFDNAVPNSLAMRRSDAGTDLFVTLRMPAIQIARVRIAPDVKGIDGIRAPGACNVTIWDFENRDTLAPVPCDFVDIEQQFKDNLQSAHAFAQSAPQKLKEAEEAATASRKALADAQTELAAKPDDAERKKAWETARYAAQINDFMLIATSRSAASAERAVTGARQFLLDYQEQNRASHAHHADGRAVRKKD